MPSQLLLCDDINELSVYGIDHLLASLAVIFTIYSDISKMMVMFIHPKNQSKQKLRKKTKRSGRTNKKRQKNTTVVSNLLNSAQNMIRISKHSFYRAMLCIRGTSHGPMSVSVRLYVTSRCSIETAE